jgi:hypothetical protein
MCQTGSDEALRYRRLLDDVPSSREILRKERANRAERRRWISLR